MMTKRIPVSEETWKMLGKMKEAGQTYDDLLQKLMQIHNRVELANKMDSAQKGEGKWIDLENV